MGKHLTSAGGERNAAWLLCHLENVYYKSGKARIAGPSSRLGTKKAFGWETIGEPTRRSSELHGVVRACSFRSRDDISRWSPALFRGMKETPKQPDPSRPAIHIPIIKKEMIGPEHLEEPVAVEAAPSEAVIPRRFRIMTNMLAACGYSAACAVCRHKRSGFTGAGDQTDACRRRIAEAIRTDNSERGSRFKVCVSRAPVLAERAPEEEEEAVLDALEDDLEAGSVVDVVEMYSPPRTTPVARRMVLVAGQALDLTHGLGFPVATP